MSKTKAITVLLDPVQVKHLELMVSRGRGSSVEEVITRLIDKDRYADPAQPRGELFEKGGDEEESIFERSERPKGNLFDSL